MHSKKNDNKIDLILCHSKILALVFYFIPLTFAPQLASADDPNSVFSDSNIFDDWNIDGHILSGTMFLSSPQDRLLAVPNNPSEQSIGYVESLVNINAGIDNWYFDTQFYFRAANKQPVSWNDKQEFAVPQMSVTYLRDDFDIIFGRTNISAGSSKSANVVDFFSDNPILTSIFPSQIDQGLRTGQLTIGANFIGPDNIGFEVYAIPKISALSFNDKPLLSSNQEESYGWLRLSKDFNSGLHLEVMSRVHETDWRLGTNVSYAVGDKLILYSDMLYRNLQVLPDISNNLSSAEFNVQKPNVFFSIGGTYAVSPYTSFSLELLHQTAGYSESEKERVFDLLQSPTNPLYSAVVSTLSGDPLLSKNYVYAEAEFLWLSDTLRFIPSGTFAEDGSQRISSRLLYSIGDDGLSLDTRLVSNLGSDRSEFGSKTLGTGLSVSLVYKF